MASRRWANLCVIPTARSFSGMASQSTSMSGNGQKTILEIRATSSRRASKIATVAELSASIAHELNQPLMAVLGNAKAARRWLAANPPNLTETNTSIERILRNIRFS